MAGFYPIPPVIEPKLLVQFGDEHKAKDIDTDWRGGSGAIPDVFLEGITSTPDGALYVVDVPFGRILRVDPDRKITECVQWDGEPNGLAVRDDGKMIVADYKKGLLLFDPKENSIKPFLARRNLESWKGLNDLVISSSGDIYFTDQGQTGLQDQTGGVWCYTAAGRLHQLISNGISPNGIVLSPDEKSLYVAMTRDNSVWRMPILPDGTTTKANRFFMSFGNSGPDGLTTDEEGNVFIAHPSLACVFVLDKHGIPKVRIQCSGDRPLVTNCIFGSGPNDRQRLYITNSLDGKIEYVDWHCKGGELQSRVRILSPDRSSQGAIAAIFIRACGWSIGWFSMPYLLTSEVFPTRIRSHCVSFMMALHGAMNFGNSRATPSLLVAGNRYGAFIFFAGICIISLVFVGFCMPETAGRSLEGMDKLFAVPLHQVHKYAYPTDEDLKPEMRSDSQRSATSFDDKDAGSITHVELAREAV